MQYGTRTYMYVFVEDGKGQKLKECPQPFPTIHVRMYVFLTRHSTCVHVGRYNVGRDINEKFLQTEAMFWHGKSK